MIPTCAMQTDRKIGFAMGILLIGAVSALFFRNEPFLDPQVLAVEVDSAVNEQIEEREIAIYRSQLRRTTDSNAEPRWTMRDVLQDFRHRQQTTARPIEDARTAQELEHWERDSFDGYRSRRQTVAARKRQQEEQSAVTSRMSAPAPQLPEKLKQSTYTAVQETQVSPPAAAADEPVFDDPTVVGVGYELPATAAVSAEPKINPADEPAYQEYQVQYGDTLSGIAERFLGAQSKYREIYEINRDRMRSPDTLAVGMRLRIPLTDRD